jgi:hypothetical protein
MKKAAFMLASVLMTFNCLTQNLNTANGYLTFLNKQSEAVTKDMWSYTSSIARSRSAKSIDIRRNELLKQIQSSIAAVNAKPAFNDKNYIKEAFVKYLEINYVILNEDYAKIVDLEAVAEQSYVQMEAYMMVQDQVNEKMKATTDELTVQVEKYAAENQILMSDEMSSTGKKLDRAGKAFDYYEPVYLTFFKSFIQELTFLNALNSLDFASAEQARTALLSTATEGLAKNKELSNYEGDSSLKSDCAVAMRFFMDEAGDGFVKILDFYTKKENFEKLDAAMKSKKKSEVTKADTDAYNKAVNEYNAAVKTYNLVNTGLNNKRSKILNDWNESVQAFLLKHAA